MKNRILKLLMLVLLPLIPFMGISNAEYYDKETVASNNLSATSLNMILQNGEGDTYSGLLFHSDKLKENETLEKKIYVAKDGGLNFYYYPEFKFKNGNESVCSGLNVVVKKEGTEVYHGILKEFNQVAEPVQLAGTKHAWEFGVSHENKDINLQGKKCEFDIVFKAFQNVDYTGFSDTEKVSNVIGFAYEAHLAAYHNKTLKKFIFTLSDLINFDGFNYILTYKTNDGDRGVEGSQILNGESHKKIQILLGSCSSGGCTYESNPSDFSLEIELLDIDGEVFTISKQL